MNEKKKTVLCYLFLIAVIVLLLVLRAQVAAMRVQVESSLDELSDLMDNVTMYLKTYPMK
ncbi:MAG: hypothetical protein LUE89_08855 [Clostridiales bacterium]|nr:hypothetical protein [Clostridiales bacterium]